MAASVLPLPGELGGPCVDWCEHRDCTALRAVATGRCRRCRKPIGYDTGFYKIQKDATPDFYVEHATCAEREAENKARIARGECVLCGELRPPDYIYLCRSCEVGIPLDSPDHERNKRAKGGEAA